MKTSERPMTLGPPAYQGRGVWECRYQEMPGRRLFVALNDASVVVAKTNMEPHESESDVRAHLADRLVRWERGQGFLRAI